LRPAVIQTFTYIVRNHADVVQQVAGRWWKYLWTHRYTVPN